MVDMIYLIVAFKFSINFDLCGPCELAAVEDGSSGFVSDALLVVGLVADILASVPIDSRRAVDHVALEEVANVAARPFSLGEELAVSVKTIGAGKRTLLDCEW